MRLIDIDNILDISAGVAAATVNSEGAASQALRVQLNVDRNDRMVIENDRISRNENSRSAHRSDSFSAHENNLRLSRIKI